MKMIQYKLTNKGLEIIRYIPFIVLEQLAGGEEDSTSFEMFESSSSPGQIILKGGQNGKVKRNC